MKNLLLITLLLIFSSNAFAQDPPANSKNGNRWEKIENYKVGYLTQKLDLTTGEAEKFWPVYNKYQDKIRELRMETRANRRSMDIASKSDEEVEAMVDAQIEARLTRAKLEKAYHQELKKVLPVRKVALYYTAEEQFKRELLRRLRESQGNRRSPR